MARLRVAVLVSGRGSNLQTLIDECARPGSAAEIVLVLSNVPGAYGLERAAAAGIPTATVDHKAFDGRAPFEDAMQEKLAAAGAELVCLAGFMRLLTAGFVERWRDRMINIHPALLPAYKGLHTHARALADGVRFAGCTVHYVRPDMDAGPIIVQGCVSVLPDDDEDALAARVLTMEHRAYPLALRLIAEGKVRVTDERAVIKGAAAPGLVMLNPDDGA
jgi:phosphoribosylglycinamide formyltransferase-1